MRHGLRTALLALVAGAVLAFPGVPADAVVPPTNCGFLKVGGKRYQIKTHRVSCRRARPWSSRYLRYHRRPTGWRCRDFPRRSSFKFMCERGDRDFYAVKRRS